MNTMAMRMLPLLLVFTSCTQLALCQLEDAFSFEASYVSDYVNSSKSAIENANAYMGMIDLATSFDTKAARLWSGGEFYFHLENTHGATASADLVGDLQVFSNIDNGDYTYLYQLWYKHTWRRFSITVGNHDLNSTFVASDYASEYINSSFGIMPSVSMNVMVSIFPKPCLGSIIEYQLSDATNIKAAVYEGDPLSLDDEPYNTSFSINKDGGYLSIGEFSYSVSLLEKLEGTYRVGGYYHSNYFIDMAKPTLEHKGNYGLYFIADQLLSKITTGRSSLGMFVKFGLAPEDRNEYPFFAAAGLNLYAPFSKRQDDSIGLALASLSINKQLVGHNKPYQHNYEQVIECFYKATISQNIVIQPEVQYIINPGAMASNNNTAIGLIRTYINF
ncbi:carbohydrate porin [Carboxylicivirga sp. M1479]|uniref:carbohydrate porin n=1 Tax=Carboxylicivirga sp. M1479 TaxID=2594476 RepID=UPI00163DB044|nr:carbohydrate porin [Carboxylicivirga sp. M1479]